LKELFAVVHTTQVRLQDLFNLFHLKQIIAVNVELNNLSGLLHPLFDISYQLKLSWSDLDPSRGGIHQASSSIF